MSVSLDKPDWFKSSLVARECLCDLATARLVTASSTAFVCNNNQAVLSDFDAAINERIMHIRRGAGSQEQLLVVGHKQLFGAYLHIRGIFSARASKVKIGVCYLRARANVHS